MQAIQSVEERLQPAINAGHQADSAFGRMAGRSPVMQRLFSQMRHTARHLRVAAIEGESGTGKMLAAHTLHEFALDPEAPFVPCPAAKFLEPRPAIALIPSRSTARPEFSMLPALKQACCGTLVLTQVDDLSPALQVRLLELLRWIDHQHIQRELDSIPYRVLCLAGQSLRKLTSASILRPELANRLTAIRFKLPPLRERREDIPLLADIFAQRFSATHGKPVRGVGLQALPRIVEYDWPGNVRELESAICSAALNCEGQWIRPIDLPAFTVAPASAVPAHLTSQSSAQDDDPNLDRAILRHIQRVLARVDGNKLRAAKMLGISRSTLYRLLDSAATH